MKNLFRSFKKTTDAELKTLWKDAIFVFDTNVLHSVYRYKASTCEDVLKLMEQLQDRVWIPYHVALEFHRNRLSVISSQHKKFDETRKAIQNALDGLKKELANLQLDKRHSHIDPNPLIDGINKLMVEYLDELTEQENQCIKVDSKDLLLSRIESIFNNRLGEKPTNDDIRKIMDEGRERYKALIPPGYKDAIKEKDIDNKYTYNSVSYEKQFGDLIVWKQIIDHMKKLDIKYLIFVTDDNKEDWWEITQGKTTNFRIELIDEILSSTNLKNFKAYSLAGFLTESKQYLKNSVSEDTIEDVYLTSIPSYDSKEISKLTQINIFDDKMPSVSFDESIVSKKYKDENESNWLEKIKSSSTYGKNINYITISHVRKKLEIELDSVREKIEFLKSKISKINEIIKNEKENEIRNTLEEECSRLINTILRLSIREDKLRTRLNSLE
ncbi:DUF4935 domain-containing protein [Shewanella sp. NKUCC01_JLK]|uniref:PIN-like domain-containing protein n=1 Tax=Shewanella sp. NKUCC01_JLK TaxID=2842123 RepID=UPI001C5BEC3D|nr:PIN-like domain-containing protein [Shewanella sp. NKUCC01_JLK]MBW3514936.1 DUF4935 domain-containing protein [Shewanella sp. NKUCC01_JLK]